MTTRHQDRTIDFHVPYEALQLPPRPNLSQLHLYSRALLLHAKCLPSPTKLPAGSQTSCLRSSLLTSLLSRALLALITVDVDVKRGTMSDRSRLEAKEVSPSQAACSTTFHVASFPYVATSSVDHVVTTVAGAVIVADTTRFQPFPDLRGVYAGSLGHCVSLDRAKTRCSQSCLRKNFFTALRMRFCFR